MSQLMLLLEIVLLAATAYMYWTTRKLVTELQNNAPDPPQTRYGFEDAVTAREMSQNVTALLAELESTASCAHNDLIRRNAQLQETLKEAEAVRSELHSLLDKSKSPFAPPENKKEVINTSKSSKSPEEASSSLTLAEALINFGNYLQESDRSESTISRLTSDARGFITWLGGQRYENVPLDQIGATEIGSYLDYLRSQDYKPSTIKSKQSALRTFSDWVEIQLSSNENFQEKATNSKNSDFYVNKRDSDSSPVPSQTSWTNLDRYQAVFTLINQGVDQSVIAARTGLEQEAIRMLLATRVQPSSIAH